MTHPFRPGPAQRQLTWAPAWLLHIGWWFRQPVTGRWLMPFCIVVLIASVWAMTGCGNVGLQIQAQTADSVGEAANSALPVLVAKYREEGFRELERLKAQDDATQGDANAALAKIKAKWKPIWDAWEALSVAQNAWADALEGSGDTAAALSGLKEAYCGLREVWPEDIPAVPLAPLRCGK